jgi:S1-C subfamily serine protease
MAVESWKDLSDGLVGQVKRAASSVVRVDGRRRGSVSGLVWSSDGTILTASHGLEWDDEVEIGLPSGETAAAELVGRDPSTDLALLRAKGAPLAAPEWSEDALEVGQLLLALTRPGRGPRAALGLVSRLGEAWRTASGGKLDRYVELDLALHHGFSGGLVLDLAGRAVGLATAGLARGTPLLVPTATLRRVAKAILTHGGIRRGYLGVSSFPVRLPGALEQTCGQASALLLTAVEDGSPAGRAGLMVGDLLLSLGGNALGHMGDLLPLLEEERIGDEAVARIIRGGAVQEVKVTIGSRSARRQEGRP